MGKYVLNETQRARKREYMKRYYQIHKEEVREYNRRPEVILRKKENWKVWYQNPEVRERRQQEGRKWYEKAKERLRSPEIRTQINVRVKAKRESLKHEVFGHYGTSIQCYCCGEQEESFLTLGHINEDGAHHRRILGVKGGREFYAKLKRLGFPNDPPLRLECFNCNIAAWRNNGICPHKSDI